MLPLFSRELARAWPRKPLRCAPVHGQQAGLRKAAASCRTPERFSVGEDRNPLEELICPVPLPARDKILLGHGSGGRLSADLLREVFLPAFQNPVLAQLNDQAVVNVDGVRLAFTTDSFVVNPLFFPGGDIGSLAVYGTVNDLAMGGAEPLFLSAGFIIEEGLLVETLRRVVLSFQRAAEKVGV